ncbi:MAG: ABC transporter permease [Bacilli bacterium]|nr:ABC transporter permease [Bacilli bacterium]
MYLIKNAYLNITRKKGRNILIGIIIAVITVGASIALSIQKSGAALVSSYKEKNPLEISFNMNPENFRKQEGSTEKPTIQSLTLEEIKKYGDSSYVSDYYYSIEASMSAKDIEAVSYTEEDTETDNTDQNRPDDNRKMETGDFRITGYSNPSYITEFIEGTKKIKEGEMVTSDNTESVLVISEELAENNNLKVGDTISLYNSTDENTTYDFKIIGIYEDNSEVETNSFMNMNAMNSRNQMYTNFTAVQNLLSSDSSSKGNRIEAKYYLNSNSDLSAFEKEVRNKGLSDTYTVTTNEEEVLASVKPIQNVSQFSLTFLLIILVVGAVILGIINLINIRERKYEIGVLRAIGMKKSKVAFAFVMEIFMVALVSLVVGAAIGTGLSQPVTNAMLKNEIENSQTQNNQITENFGNGNFQRPSMNRGRNATQKTNVEYVDTLAVHMDIATVTQLFLVSLLLTLTTSAISIIFISRYEPNKILQDR